MRHAPLIAICPCEAALVALERSMLLRIGVVQSACLHRFGRRTHTGSLSLAARYGNPRNGFPVIRSYLGEILNMIPVFLLGVLATMFVAAGVFFLRFWME